MSGRSMGPVGGVPPQADAGPMRSAPGSDAASAGSPSSVGSIYDLGYQHYEGPRRGRAGAVAALYTDSLRACFGLGRSARAKVVPMGLTVLALLPAVIVVAMEAVVRGAMPGLVRHEEYVTVIVGFLILFVAAQAPELVGRDQRHHVLPLYFSRAIGRIDYPAAKLLALTTALAIVSLLPQAGLLLGTILSASDPVASIADEAPSVLPILASSLVASLVMAALGLAVSAWTPRRAYATAAIFALFFVPMAAVAAITEAARRARAAAWDEYVPLLSPTATIEGASAWLFGIRPTGDLFRAGLLPGQVYLGVALGMVLVAIVLLAWRYRRVPA